MPDHASSRQSGAHKASWLDRAVDILKPQPGPPPKPHAPPVHEGEWHKSVERKQIVPGLTVHDVGLSIFGETRSLHDRPGSSEPIDTARQRVAPAIINDAELSQRTGKPRNAVHPPTELSEKVKGNREERAAYESSLRAAREAFLSGHDPTRGATHFNMRPRPDRSNWKFPNGTPEGLTLSTQSGPYDDSLPDTNAGADTTRLNTYLPDENAKKIQKKR